MARFPSEPLERLAEQIVGGEVVFFIGSGFSLGSAEDNSTKRLQARRFVRSYALTEVLGRTLKGGDPARNMRKEFYQLFEVESDGREVVTFFSNGNPDKAAKIYYEVNDWMCTSYGLIMDWLLELGAAQCKVALDDANKLGNDDLKTHADDPVRLHPIKPAWYRALSEDIRGKVLFLETLGFSNEEMWGGKPEAEDAVALARTYQGKLRPRHDVLAALSREGLTPTVLTTNYDLLLEYAYRGAGFEFPVEEGDRSGYEHPFRARNSRFRVVASAAQFFRQRARYGCAYIIKIHGCVQSYRTASDKPEALKRYLPSVVYTYRKIQNWREGSTWSRDLLRTLLRSRAFVFFGYSGVDPVIHDTIRTVYEDMERQRSAEWSVEHTSADQTRAYYFDLAEKPKFHPGEVLRAASRAAGEREQTARHHGNYIPHHREDFPNLDDMCRWAMHRTGRHLREQILTAELDAVIERCLHDPARDEDLGRFRKHFRMLVKEEFDASATWTDTQYSLDGFERVVGWTERFHAGMRRDLAYRDWVLRNHRPAPAPEEGYCPMTDHPAWVTWGVVLEVAIRRWLAIWCGKRKSRRPFWVDARVHVGWEPECAVVFSKHPDPAPRRISIRYAPLVRFDHDELSSNVVAGTVR